MFPNATVNGTHQGGAAFGPRRVQIDFKNNAGQVGPNGVVILDMLRDAPDAPWKNGDVLTITALDGASAPAPARYTVQGVQRHGGILPRLTATLKGFGGTGGTG